MRGIFVTGTGTQVGKSVVAAGILRWLREQGVNAAPMKPIQTGCVPGMTAETGGEEGLRVPDLEFSLAAAGLMPKENEMELMCPYRFQQACSPHLAGRLAGVIPRIDHIAEAAEKLGSAYQALVVEGAGGVMAPINESQTMLDIIARLGLPVVIVALPGLGTINHTLLTLHMLRGAGAKVLGVIYNDIQRSETDEEEERMIREDNPITVEKFGNTETLGRIPHMEEVADTAEGLPSWNEFNEAMTGMKKILAAVKGETV